MCGFVGFYVPRGGNAESSFAALRRAAARIAHRGPDDSGDWMDGEAGIAFAHRRLAVVDLSPAGKQPMQAASGRYVLVFNGEIYNHLEIRRELNELAPSWRGHSDTETLLGAIDAWGLATTLRKCVGMFALALWDRQTRTLSLARDRMGEKPLYYGWQGDTFVFGSELKSLRELPGFRNDIDTAALPLYLRHGYVPAPWSIWKGIKKLLPGTLMHVDASDMGATATPKSYWSLDDQIHAGQAAMFSGSDADAVAALERRITQSIAGQMMADVPVGAFLSGGIDSSVVVALMQVQSPRPVKTFTIGFAESGYNEAEYAAEVARHLGTDHTELYVSSEQSRAVIPALPEMYDEPFGDSSAIPTYLVSKLAREQVTVSLSGDGGDELFGGYSRYFNQVATRLWHLTQRLPPSLRIGLRAVCESGLPGVAQFLLRHAGLLSDGKSVETRALLVAALTHANTRDELYRTCISQWQKPPVAPRAAGMPIGPPYFSGDNALIVEQVERMMRTDSLSYLPDDILVKVDRAAMAVSLESRVPLLDHRIVELAWQMPYSLKVRDGQGKWLLRQVLHRHVPRHLVERPKMGFGVPIDHWLRGPLREWAEDLLSESALNAVGMLDAKPIRQRWLQHLSGRNNWRDSLWLVLMLQAWTRNARL